MESFRFHNCETIGEECALYALLKIKCVNTYESVLGQRKKERNEDMHISGKSILEVFSSDT